MLLLEVILCVTTRCAGLKLCQSATIGFAILCVERYLDIFHVVTQIIKRRERYCIANMYGIINNNLSYHCTLNAIDIVLNIWLLIISTTFLMQ